VLNAWREPLRFELPPAPGGWRRWIDTSREPPEDVCEWAAAALHPAPAYDVAPRSVVVLIAATEPSSP
jgi:glycogen operon protein